MRLIPVVSALALASSAAAAARKYYPDQLIAVTPTTADINELALNAIDGYFRVGYCATTHHGEAPTTSCPSNVKNCPPGNTTAILYSRDQAALDAEVPGGQYIFVDKDGFLAYTAPHAGIIPKHSTATGFHISGPNGTDPRGRFHFKGNTTKGTAEDFVACPGADGGAPYNIMVKYENFFKKYGHEHKCVDIEVALTRYTSNQPAAWQYDVASVA
ncbi:hypothetical protein K461DRAFT_273751 [Myriangium duriaei CBS 260.36]|uniref:Uncharacterized protein n=1 Tax=Myriangium duriaei CBS 260.36 TaxID=1168546 RepID=A0A9P4J9Q2_9PEZI|nr:hypothetical protein K461DRAFT_273751 [Myriangium duriaei CBS 260.36]